MTGRDRFFVALAFAGVAALSAVVRAQDVGSQIGVGPRSPRTPMEHVQSVTPPPPPSAQPPRSSERP